MTQFEIMLIGLIIGLFIRAVAPYIRKKQEAPFIEFEKKYLATVILSFLTLLELLPELIKQVPAVGNPYLLFLFSLLVGYGNLALYNEIYKWLSLIAEIKRMEKE